MGASCYISSPFVNKLSGPLACVPGEKLYHFVSVGGYHINLAHKYQIAINLCFDIFFILIQLHAIRVCDGCRWHIASIHLILGLDEPLLQTFQERS